MNRNSQIELHLYVSYNKLGAEDQVPDGASVQLSRKEREFLRHRGEIINAAERVFSEKGYVSTTMEEIARQAEFGVGTLYKFFDNKADLHTEILRTKLNQMEQQAYAAIEAGTTPLEKIERYFSLRIEFFWGNQEFFRLFQETTEELLISPEELVYSCVRAFVRSDEFSIPPYGHAYVDMDQTFGRS